MRICDTSDDDMTDSTTLMIKQKNRREWRTIPTTATIEQENFGGSANSAFLISVQKDRPPECKGGGESTEQPPEEEQGRGISQIVFIGGMPQTGIVIQQMQSGGRQYASDHEIDVFCSAAKRVFAA